MPKKKPRITFSATITPTSIKVTAIPLADDVTPSEMYIAESKLALELAEKWFKVMEAMGAPLEVTSMKMIPDHEPEEDKPQ